MHRKEWWQDPSMSDEILASYFDNLIKSGNIILYIENDIVVGYVEFWRINFEQLGRILCGAKFLAESEDITNGSIAYLANVHVIEEHRLKEPIKILKESFFKRNFHCDYFVGEARRKKHQPFKCFSRKEFLKKYSGVE